MANISIRPEIVSSFFRVSSDNKVLMNEEYEIVSVQGKSLGFKYRKEKNGRFNINSDLEGHYDYEDADASDLIPDYILNDIKSVSTISELQNKYSSNPFYSLRYESISDRWSLEFFVPAIIKQTKSEPGYKKHDIIVKANPRFLFYYDGDQVTRVDGIVNIRNFTEGYLYDDAQHEFNNINDLVVNNYSTFSIREGVCMNTNAGLIISDTNDCTIDEPFIFYSGGYNLVPYFVAEKGTVKYEITNTVNGQGKYNASNNKELEYKIDIKNTGNAASSGNVITTYIPKEITVNEKRISDNGIYNKYEHSISWEIDYIDVGEVLSVSYEATAPEGMNGKELIGHSIINNEQVKEAFVSNNTIVTLDKVIEVVKNPETGTMVYIANTNIGMPLSFLLALLLLMFVVLMVLAKQKVKKFRKTQ